MCFPSDPLEVADMMEAAAREIRRLHSSKRKLPAHPEESRRYKKLETLLINIDMEIDGVSYTTKHLDRYALAQSLL